MEEKEPEKPQLNNLGLGIDLGIKDFAVLSTGMVYNQYEYFRFFDEAFVPLKPVSGYFVEQLLLSFLHTFLSSRISSKACAVLFLTFFLIF